MNLWECLKEVPDPRRKQGQRYSLGALLLIIIMGILRGKYGYREIGRFCRMHQSYLVKRFGFKNKKAPSHVSICACILSVDFAAVQAAFHKWTASTIPLSSGEWVAIDGKSIRSTVSNPHNEYQNFVSLVSLFSSAQEKVLQVEKLENKKGTEAQVKEYQEFLVSELVLEKMEAELISVRTLAQKAGIVPPHTAPLKAKKVSILRGVRHPSGLVKEQPGDRR